MIASVALFAFVLSSCGGGGSSGGSGGGGGGGASGLSISSIAPSMVMVGIPLAQVNVYGQGFTRASQVLVDGQPVQTFWEGSGPLQAEINFTLSFTTGTHQFSVQSSGKVSNSLPYTVYAPQQGPFVMQAIPGFLVGEPENNPTFIVAADVDGDGRADVVMPDPLAGNSGSIAILSGQADGTLSDAQYIPTATPYALAVGDVDGNGTVDLVPITDNSGSGSTTVSIMTGDGHGNFQPPVIQQTFPGIYPGGATLADLDGDGKPDLVLFVQEPSGLTYGVIWLKNTGGGFSAPTTLTTNSENFFLIADFNSDGKPDILYTVPGSATTTQSMHILMNQGNGKFSDQVPGGINEIVGQVSVLDFNLDGIPDLVVEAQQGNQGILYSFAGNGDGSFTQVASRSTPAVIRLVTGDFDHDGFPDLASPFGSEPAGILYLFGDGHGNFVPQSVVGPAGGYVAVGDFNGDGIPDVVVPDLYNFVSLALGRTDRNFPAVLSLTPATVTDVSTGDINGDGLPDIFVGGNFFNSGIPGTVFLNQGNSSFQLAAYTDPFSSWIADVSGKGVVDLLGGNYSLEIWPNNGTASFTPFPITIPQPTSDVVVADLDGDGHPDFISGCTEVGCPGQIFWGDGSYQFTPVPLANLFAPYVIGDFNGDGKLDIATGAYTYLNMGGRTFQQVPTTLSLGNGVLAVVGDFNGDGKDDVAVNIPGDSAISIYYSNGDGTFYQGTMIDPGQYPGALAVGDFNGDGRLDLAVGLMSSQQACLLFNNGNGQFTRSFLASGANTIVMTASDLNRNGKPDLVIGNFVLDFAPANVNVVFHK